MGRGGEGRKVWGRKGEYASLALGGWTPLIVLSWQMSPAVCPSASAGSATRTLAKRMIKITIGWLSPTERASVSAISLRHIIWLPHESHAGLSLPTAVLRVNAFGYVKSLGHILASLGTPLGQSQ